MKKSLLPLLLVIIAVSLAACDSSSSPASSGTKSKTGSASANTASSTDYPKRTITIVVGFSAGGTADLGARILGKYMSGIVGTNVIVTNVTGGTGVVAVGEVFNAAPDGYTIANLAGSPAFAASGKKHLPFDITKDFIAVAGQQRQPRTIAFRADDPRFSNGKEFLAYAKAHPGELSIATSGAQSVPQAMLLMFKDVTGIEFTSIHTAGSAEQKTQLLGKHVDAAAISIGDLNTYDKGSIKIVAVATEERMADFPDVPTFRELGADVVLATSRGFAVKSDTPPAIIAYLEKVIAEVSRMPAYNEELKKAGVTPYYMSGSDYTALITKEMAVYKKYFGN